MSFKEIKTIKNLSDVVQISENDINDFINDKLKYIKIVNVIKNNGEVRVVHNILSLKYKKLIRFIYNKLYGISTFNDYVQGFVKKRGTITNAKKHLNKRIVINVDIKDFFNSITIKQINKALKELGLGSKLVQIIIKLITLDGKLPTGFSTSPLISNLACKELDKEFYEFANKNNYVYSRYGDDITLSTNKHKDSDKKGDIIFLLERHNFKLNEEKYKIQKRGGEFYVTGLTVCERNTPRIPKYIKRRLRQEIYYVKKFGLKNHVNKVGEKSVFIKYGWKSIKGRINYVRPLEVKLANYIREMSKNELINHKNRKTNIVAN